MAGRDYQRRDGERNERTEIVPVVRPQLDEALVKAGADEMRRLVLAEAAILRVDLDLLRIPENIGEVVKAAIFTRDYGFKPGIHMHMQSFKTKAKRVREDGGGEVEVFEDRLALVIGEQAYKASMQIQANRARDYVDVEYEPMGAEEVAAYVRDNCPGVTSHKNDRGTRARVLSASAARMYADMGRKYDPEWTFGLSLWLGKPKEWDGKVTYPNGDEKRIPQGRTPQDVADRRAIKAAIMKKYPLLPLDNMTAEQRAQRVIEQAAPDSPLPAGHDDDLPVTRHYERDEDGQILRAGSGRRPPKRAPVDNAPIDGDFRVDDDADEDVPFGHVEPEAQDNPFLDKEEPPMPKIDYAAAVPQKTSGNDQTFVEWARKRHRADGGPATPAQYRYLAGVIDSICGGSSRAHNCVLEVLIGSPADTANPPSFVLAAKLLDFLCETRTVDGEKVANPDYRPDIVQIVKRLWDLCLEAEGQMRMKLEA